MGQSLDDGQIRIRQFDIFADDSDAHILLRRKQPLDHLPPFGQIRLRRADAQQTADPLVHALFVNHQRHLIDAACIEVFKNAVRRNVAEQTDFGAHIARNRLFASADDDIRLNAQARQLLD